MAMPLSFVASYLSSLCISPTLVCKKSWRACMQRGVEVEAKSEKPLSCWIEAWWQLGAIKRCIQGRLALNLVWPRDLNDSSFLLRERARV